MAALTGRVDEVDLQVDRISRLIGSAQKTDRELAAGLGCAESMSSIQGHIDRASAAVESLARDLKKWKSERA